MSQQRQLFAGLNCLPGQENLFPTDGPPAGPTSHEPRTKGEEPMSSENDRLDQLGRDLLARLTPGTIAAIITDLSDAGRFNHGPAPEDVASFASRCQRHMTALPVERD
jgi:hypothetical protein